MTMRLAIILGGLSWFAWPTAARAGSFEQSVGVYADSAAVERRQVGIAVGFDFAHAGQVTGSSFDLRASRDEFLGGLPGAPEVEGATADEIYAYTASLATAQTVNKLTELRQSLLFNGEEQARSVTTALGVSHWVAQETLRFSFDYMKNSVRNRQDAFLDKDFATVQRPEWVASEGVAISLRHLASPQTIVDYTAAYTSISNRPPASLGALAVRQFVVALNGALLGGVTRMVNTGELTTQTTYGEITALEMNLGWSQTLWSGATGLLEYRNYREDEVTRAYGDELQLGSDAVTLALDQQWKGEDERVYILTAKVSRYETNIEVAANVVEFAVGAQF